MWFTRRSAGRALTVALAVGATACGGSGAGRSQVTVLAASSLTEVFERLADEYEAGHPDVDVVLVFGGSSGLAGQIQQGVSADVFASADPANMEKVAAMLVAPAVVVATNELVVAVAPGNPEGVAGVADLARDDLVVVLADAEVPAGRYAAEMLASAGVEVRPASLEQNVRAVASKVALGEADAAVVYATDVAARPAELQAISIPTPPNVVAEYPIAALSDSRDAADFVAFVLGPAGRAALTDAGFGVP